MPDLGSCLLAWWWTSGRESTGISIPLQALLGRHSLYAFARQLGNFSLQSGLLPNAV